MEPATIKHIPAAAVRQAGPWTKITFRPGEKFTGKTGVQAALAMVLAGEVAVTTVAYGEKSAGAGQMFAIPAEEEYTLGGIATAQVLLCTFDIGTLQATDRNINRLVRRAAKCYPLFCTVAINAPLQGLLAHADSFIREGEDFAHVPTSVRGRLFEQLMGSYRRPHLAHLLRPVLAQEYER